MDILFKTDKLRRLCCDSKLARRAWSTLLAEKLRKRLDEMRDADTLDDLRRVPQSHCEELKGNRKGRLSVRLEGGCRLIFEPADDPVPRKPDGGLNWLEVQTVRILDVEDYH